MTLLDVVMPGATNSIRSDRHPVLEPGSRAFPQGRYRLAFERTSAPDSDPAANALTFTLHHQIEGAPLITRLVEDGAAAFACIVAAPRSSYRELHHSSEAAQTIVCDRDDLGEPPLFTPLVVCTDPVEMTLDAHRDGVDAIWQGQTIALDRGHRLAIGHVIRLEASSMAHLLSMRADNTLKPGQFIVDAQAEPFQFIVRLHPDLHRFLKHKSDHHHQRHNIIVHIVTACFALLHREYREEDEDSEGWDAIPNLKALAAHLEAKGIRHHWCDESFRPEEAATQLYPLTLPETGGAAE